MPFLGRVPLGKPSRVTQRDVPFVRSIEWMAAHGPEFSPRSPAVASVEAVYAPTP